MAGGAEPSILSLWGNSASNATRSATSTSPPTPTSAARRPRRRELPHQRPHRAAGAHHRHGADQEGRGRSQRLARTARASSCPRHRAAADEVLAGKLRSEFVVDVYQAGAGTSHNMNTNEVLANRAAELLGEKLGTYKRIHPNDHVNMGQSTNDVYPTATRLAILFALKDLLTASARAVGPSRGEEPRVRGCPEDRAHAPAGRGTDHARPGVRRLRRERRSRDRRSRAHRRRNCSS